MELIGVSTVNYSIFDLHRVEILLCFQTSLSGERSLDIDWDLPDLSSIGKNY